MHQISIGNMLKKWYISALYTDTCQSNWRTIVISKNKIYQKYCRLFNIEFNIILSKIFNIFAMFLETAKKKCMLNYIRLQAKVFIKLRCNIRCSRRLLNFCIPITSAECNHYGMWMRYSIAITSNDIAGMPVLYTAIL